MVCVVVDVAMAELDRLHERIAGRFARAEPRACSGPGHVAGLVAGLERKNGWTLAEHAGQVAPDGMQRLLRRADWEVDGVGAGHANIMLDPPWSGELVLDVVNSEIVFVEVLYRPPMS